MEIDLSIIICSYNRAKILEKCLHSIIDFGTQFINNFEIIVVDNNSQDDTENIVRKIKEANPNYKIKYIKENNQGLSYARNRGALESNGKFLFYLDDDAFLQEDTLIQCFKTLEKKQYKFFGGLYEAFYLNEKPRWIPNDFGTKKTKLNEVGILPDDEIIEGGIMVIEKTLLEDLGMFNVKLGMKGKDLGFSEESELQQKAKDKGVFLGLNPKFKVFHIVTEKKYKIGFHLRAYYVLARDRQLSKRPIRVNTIRTIFLLPLRIVKYFVKMIKEKDYYYQNFLWDSFSSLFLVLGKMSGKLKKLS